MSTTDQMGSEENQGSTVPVRNKTSLKFNADELSMQSLNVPRNAALWLASSKQVLEAEA